MNCHRCEMPLPPGAEHANADACIIALRAANHVLREQATGCRACGVEIPVVLCPGCAVAVRVKGQAANAAGKALDAAVDWLMKEGDEDEGKGDGKRWKGGA